METDRGFVALLSSVVISFVLIVMTVAMAQKGVVGRLILLDIENKETSEALAFGCVEVARVAVINNASYQATDILVPVGNASCLIASVTPDMPSAGSSEIEVTASSSSATTNLRVEVDASTGGILSWSEVAVL